MIVTKAAIFAAGYVVGTRAGRERYAQIIAAAALASQRLEEYSARHPGGGPEGRGGGARPHA